ncbi:hypothetical protein KM043_009427 [Ampulex compressa]|nr:hypothetical protein KM043_009427 [Ampulex compressa]
MISRCGDRGEGRKKEREEKRENLNSEMERTGRGVGEGESTEFYSRSALMREVDARMFTAALGGFRERPASRARPFIRGSERPSREGERDRKASGVSERSSGWDEEGDRGKTRRGRHGQREKAGWLVSEQESEGAYWLAGRPAVRAVVNRAPGKSAADVASWLGGVCSSGSRGPVDFDAPTEPAVDTGDGNERFSSVTPGRVQRRRMRT